MFFFDLYNTRARSHVGRMFAGICSDQSAQLSRLNSPAMLVSDSPSVYLRFVVAPLAYG